MAPSEFYLDDEDECCPYVVVRSKTTEASDGRRYGFDLNKKYLDMTSSDQGIAYITRDSKGTISQFCDEVPDLAPFPTGSIAVPVGGAVGFAKLIHRPFYVGRDTYVLVAKEDSMSEFEKAAHVQMIRNQSWRYNFGRQLNNSLHSHIRLERFKLSPLQRLITSSSGKMSMDSFSKQYRKMKFGLFKLEELGSIKVGMNLTDSAPQNLEKPADGRRGHPFITSKTTNNMNRMIGFKRWDSKGRADVRNHSGTISGCVQGELMKPNGAAGTISFDFKGGSPGHAAYQQEEYYCVYRCKILTLNKSLRHPLVALFISWQIRQNNWRWQWARNVNEMKHAQYMVRLPVNKKGGIDVKGIKKLMKKLPWWRRATNAPVWLHRLQTLATGI